MTILTDLQEKLDQLIADRMELNRRERLSRSREEKKALLQSQIELNHQIQALKVVLKLFSDQGESDQLDA